VHLCGQGDCFAFAEYHRTLFCESRSLKICLLLGWRQRSLCFPCGPNLVAVAPALLAQKIYHSLEFTQYLRGMNRPFRHMCSIAVHARTLKFSSIVCCNRVQNHKSYIVSSNCNWKLVSKNVVLRLEVRSDNAYYLIKRWLFLGRSQSRVQQQHLRQSCCRQAGFRRDV